LCLTFTTSGVKAMRERLTKIIGPDAYRIDIQTFHSFCNEVITFHPERFLFAKKLVQITELEQIQIVQQLLAEGEFPLLRPVKAPDLYIKPIIKMFGELKTEGLTPTDYLKMVESREDEYEIYLAERSKKPTQKELREKEMIGRNKELAHLYQKYQEVVRENGRYDYQDMILFVLQEFKKDKNWLAGYQERYLFILVDEYQDTNGAQNELIKLLGDKVEQPNIMVVGDDEQSIYRFQGASLENLLFFSDLFPLTKKIVLNINYRSAKYLVRGARSMIGKAEVNAEQVLQLDKTIEPARQDSEEKIKLAGLTNEEQERLWIAEEIKNLADRGVNLDEIALIFRTNQEMNDYKKILASFGIYSRFLGGLDLLQEKIIVQLLDLIGVVINPFDDELFFRVLYFDWLGVDEVDHFRLLENQRQKIFSWLVSNQEVDFSDRFRDWPALVRVIKLILRIKKADANQVLPDVLELIIKESGLLKWVMAKEGRVGELAKIKSFFKFAQGAALGKSDYDLSKFVAILADMKEHALPLKYYELNFDKPAVNLMTAHGSKGLEFDYVFVVKAVDKHWSNKTNRELIRLVPGVLKKQVDKAETIDEERRLFYVAMTRARKGLYLTWAEKYGIGRDEKEVSRSMLVTEIDGEYCQEVDLGDFKQRMEKIVIGSLVNQPPVGFSVAMADYLRELVTDFVLSPTALNKYLECPRKFLYDNLLRVPKTKSISLKYGSAIHHALELFFCQFKKNKKLPEKEILLDYFELSLQREVLSEVDQKALQRNGRDSLGKYYDNYCDDWQIPIFNEYDFGKKKILMDKIIPLTGKVDRVELIEEGDGETVRVIDYKTGQPKSRNDILGKNRSSTGDYFRQLVFYKLLGRLAPNFPYRIKEVELDFVEPKKNSGKFVREVFVIEKDQVDVLKKVIHEVWGQIQSLRFDCSEDKSRCKLCDYRDWCDR